MKEIVKVNNEIIIKEQVGKFLEYIDVSPKTVKTYEVALKQFVGYLYKNNIKTPTRDDIISYREYLLESLKPTSVNAYLIAVRNLYKWLEYENITKDITKNIKGIKLETRHLKRGLSQEEIQLVLASCKDIREELLIKLMISTGLRVNEVVNIQLEDFYEEKGTTMLKVLGKGRNGIKQDVVKIDDRIFELIKVYIQQYDINNYLFTSTSNNNNGGKLTGKTIRLIIKEIFKRANLDTERLSAHSTRHTMVELALESGATIHEVSQFARHKSINTTMIYAKELNQRNSQIANKLADNLF